MQSLRATMSRQRPTSMQRMQLTREQRMLIETEALDIFTTMTNGGCTLQQTLAAVFLSGMNAAMHCKEEQR